MKDWEEDISNRTSPK